MPWRKKPRRYIVTSIGALVGLVSYALRVWKFSLITGADLLSLDKRMILRHLFCFVVTRLPRILLPP
jgi:hypothetical protein